MFMVWVKLRLSGCLRRPSRTTMAAKTTTTTTIVMMTMKRAEKKRKKVKERKKEKKRKWSEAANGRSIEGEGQKEHRKK